MLVRQELAPLRLPRSVITSSIRFAGSTVELTIYKYRELRKETSIHSATASQRGRSSTSTSTLAQTNSLAASQAGATETSE